MNGLSQVIPAILTEDPKMLEAMVRRAETFATWVQMDIMDGKFVPSRSITHEHLASLPMKFSWEAHLMVQGPERYLDGFQRAGAQKVVFHYEATSSHREVIALARDLGLEVGLALNPETAVSTVTTLLPDLDSLLLLSVHPGFYGKEFIPEVLEKVAELRSARPHLEIGMDGGVKEGNIAQIAESGVDILYVGSAILGQPQPAEAYRRLLSLAQEGSRRRQK
ncbi:MAG: ribulose-phosphate 3-epimerase [Dehalococcoidia bacterium]|nr:ribulose-phosphate 3-epimerase [Dehalococcoidia bacterium]MDP6782667.1 ribulose-phosphate 3-epimerase [Dehalococcoidia bacterium]